MNMKVFKVSTLTASALAAVAVVAVMVSCDGGSAGGAPKGKTQFNPEDERHMTSYAIGRDAGRIIREKEADIDINIVLMALREAVDSLPGKIPDSAVSAINRRVTREATERQRQRRIALEASNMAASQAFMEQNKSVQGVVTTESGLQYIMITEGTGEKPKITDNVKLHVHGTLPDGTVFESTLDGEPVFYPLAGVLKAWTEALLLTKAGGKIKIFVAPELAYGRRGHRTPMALIGPYLVLTYEIELVEIIK
ncbi:MAG: FKBP-type peptidyl-prolyl cis-trans isomerase [Chitinispirillia bacterium]|nr:FKBP-type peptidyl-prolyl cis-trans isomerase [Chitinispirillia bacterium]MCL2267570.1 FKBP-type peptidyl-prolyl cis-trans isomerase [Chitinispirillia bacterium]